MGFDTCVFLGLLFLSSLAAAQAPGEVHELPPPSRAQRWTESLGSLRAVLEVTEGADAVLATVYRRKWWQVLLTTPRKDYPGDPTAVRIGKMGVGGGARDYGDPGPPGECAIRRLLVLGPKK